MKTEYLYCRGCPRSAEQGGKLNMSQEQNTYSCSKSNHNEFKLVVYLGIMIRNVISNGLLEWQVKVTRLVAVVVW